MKNFLRWNVVLMVGTLVLLGATGAFGAEQDYTDVFCASVNGDPKYTFDDMTRPDCIDDEFAYEVDWANGSKTYEGIGQALHYATMSGKKPALVLIMKNPTDIRYVLRAKNVDVCPKIHIWTIDTDMTINKIN